MMGLREMHGKVTLLSTVPCKYQYCYAGRMDVSQVSMLLR